jgi:HlyD family secretion protein
VRGWSGWAGAWLLIVCLALGCRENPDELLLVGTVERTLVELTAPASESIVALTVRRGQRVSVGDVLVQLDKTYALAEVARSEAGIAAARTAVSVAKEELTRARQLRRTRVSSEQQLEHAELSFDEAQARLREAGALAVAAQKRTRDLDLVSPVNGVVDQLPFDAGERVPAGSVLVVVLADGNPWIRVWVPETSYVRVLPGTPAEVRIDGIDGVVHGRVLDVAREPEFTPHYALTERDRVHLVYETRVELLDAPPTLRPGVPAEVRIPAPRDAVATVP